MRNLRIDERARRAQHDQVLEGEAILAPCAAFGFDEPSLDEIARDVRREPQDALHVPHTVGRHPDPSGVPRLSVTLAGLAGQLGRFLHALGLFAGTQAVNLRSGLFALLQARAQRLHEIDDLALALWGGFRHRDFLALDLLLNRRLDARAHLVLVGVGIEFLGCLLIDELLRELQFRRLHVRLRDLYFARATYIGRVVQLLHGEHVADRTQDHDVALAACGPVADATTPRLLERFGEQCVGLGGALVGSEVVGLVVVNRIDRLDGHELGDLHRVRADFFQCLDLLGRELHVLILGELVALHHLLAFHDHAFLLAYVLLLQARAVGLVQQVEGDGVRRLSRGVELHRYGDQPEGHRQRTYGTCGHVYTLKT